ncbi:hypothetical protein ABEW61_21810 [Paenibacillus amylolyticus]|uniref:hypothetical protein n=1 Tax=Paenibacillus amylolyticus TaxID=1451 RepID=UPI003D28CCD3
MFNTNAITKFIGLCFMFLGYWRLTDFVILNPVFTFSFSIAGFFFILFDLTTHHLEQLKREKEKYYSWKGKILRFLKLSLLFLTAFSIVALPHLTLGWEQESILKLNDAIVLLGLGIVVFLIGLKSDQEIDNVLEVFEDVENRLKNIDDKFSGIIASKDEEIEKLKHELKELRDDSGSPGSI